MSLFAAFPPGLWDGIAQNTDGSPNVTGLQDIIQLIANLIHIALAIAGVAAVIFIIIGGIKYITSAGSPEGTKSAKNTLTNAVIGLVIAAAAYVIVTFIMGKL